MAFSAFFFAVMAAGAKLLGGRIPPQEVILVRGVLNALFMLWLLRRRGLSWRPKRPGLLVLRGALGHFALSCYFWSVAHQPLAEFLEFLEFIDLGGHIDLTRVGGGELPVRGIGGILRHAPMVSRPAPVHPHRVCPRWPL